MTRRTLQLLLLLTMTSAGAMAQLDCTNPVTAQKLICLFPISTQVLSNASALGTPPPGSAGGNSGFALASQVAQSLDIAIASQASQLPLASASAGTIVLYKAGVPQTLSNLGPILTDRAQAIGRGKVFIGFTASQFVFTDIDGHSLGSLPFGYLRTAYNQNHVAQSTTYTKQTTDLKFTIDQYIAVGTLGLTKRVDLSVIVPWERVSFGDTLKQSTNYVVDVNNNLLFSYTLPSSYSSGDRSGVGDIVINGKGVLYSGERATFAGGMNLRVPSGDDLNFLGSGAFGFNPYLDYSYLRVVSPHAKIGYQWNTKTELNNPTQTANGKQSLPGGVQYDFGADWAAKRYLTVAADLLGSQYVNTPRLISTQTTVTTHVGANTESIPIPSTISQNSAYSISNLSTGLKLNPYRNLVFSGNVLFQLNNNGLRARPTPLIGVSYKF
jgi:hypothetical protein